MAVVQVKSYLAGNPGISLALNDNLAIGRREGGASSQYGGGHGSDVVMLDDCNFHESVSLDRFDSERTLELKPPDGEFALMNYRYLQLLQPIVFASQHLWQLFRPAGSHMKVESSSAFHGSKLHPCSLVNSAGTCT